MYLAEDRILCWELVSKRHASWILHYVKSAYAVTDAPDGVPELISQRRRWLNGSFFTAFWFHSEMLYQLYDLIFSWFALDNYYVTLAVLTSALEDYLSIFHYPNLILNYFCLRLLIMCFLLSLGNRPQGSKVAYTLALLGFSLITVYMLQQYFSLTESVAPSEGRAIRLKDFLANTLFRNIVLSLATTLGLYIVSSLLSYSLNHGIITPFIPYLLMAPSYIAVFNVYGFANVYDVSWGTKGDNRISTDLGVVSLGKGANKNAVQVAIPVEEKDINAAYEDAATLLSSNPPKVKEK
ncbi:hypothetical protein V8E55_006431 [Tylopilus felleus]